MKAIVTGAAGFTGAVLTEQLIKQNTEVYAIVRPGSDHNSRIMGLKGVHCIPVDPKEYHTLSELIGDSCEVCYHLMWAGGRHNISELNKNVEYTSMLLESAAKCGCNRFVCTGSQAEYGVVPKEELITEDRQPHPITAYGEAKLSTCKESYKKASELEIEWIWGRIFSVIGKYESSGRMLPDLYRCLRDGKGMKLSSCTQNWDYLDVYDTAYALIALGEQGRSGEIYNIANGAYKPLKDFTERLRELIAPDVCIEYGKDADPYISLQPSIAKIMTHTGWTPKRTFEDSIKDYESFIL